MKVLRSFLLAVAIGAILLAASLVARPAVVAAPASAAPSAKQAPAAASDESDPVPGPDITERAAQLLAEHARAYRHLDAVTIHEGPTPKGEQAVSYYTDGEIVISPDHTATLEDIVAHEIWHVIDWRDNGRMDWGEQVPPTNASDYLK
jgi:hypothetical protein